MIKNFSNYNILDKELKNLVSFAKKNKLKSGFCIGNTSKKENLNFFLTPFRQNEKCIVTGVIVYSENIAKKIVQILNKYKIDYIFVDSEKKIPNPKKINEVSNLERVVKENSNIKVLTYKGNDITVEAVNSLLNILFSKFVNGLGGKKIALIGLGNIGTKLAIKLVEQGAYLYVSRRNKTYQNLICKTINLIKPKYNESIAQGLKNKNFAELDIIIAAANEKRIITKQIISKLKNKSIIIDVGKDNLDKGVISESNKKEIDIYRLDISSAFISTISSLIYSDEILKNSFGRKKINNNYFVSGGMIGHHNDIVVDNINNIKKIIGLADGKGDFVRKLHYKQKKLILKLRKDYDKIF